MMDKQEIARRITQLRVAKFGNEYGAQTRAAKWLGVKERTYSGHENMNADKPAGIKYLLKYARKYDVSLDWLIFGKGVGPSAPGYPPTQAERLYEATARLVAGASPEVIERVISYADYEMSREKASNPTS